MAGNRIVKIISTKHHFATESLLAFTKQVVNLDHSETNRL